VYRNAYIPLGGIYYIYKVSDQTNESETVGPYSKWEPNTTTISIRKSTWKRLQKHHTHYGQTFDSIITDLLNEKEGGSN
jgi:hypothetical protein